MTTTTRLSLLTTILSLLGAGCMGAEPTSAMSGEADFDEDLPGFVSIAQDAELPGETGDVVGDDNPAPSEPDSGGLEPGSPPGCGDGIIQENEECDDANAYDRDGCTSACQFDRCGDGELQHGEQCDDGNHLVDDGCTAACLFESGACMPRAEGFCNLGETFAIERLVFPADTTDVVDAYWGGLEETDAEYTMSITPTSPMRMTVGVEDEDLEVYVVETSPVGCMPGSLVGNGDVTTFDADGLARYEIVIEGLAPSTDGQIVRINLRCGA